MLYFCFYCTSYEEEWWLTIHFRHIFVFLRMQHFWPYVFWRARHRISTLELRKYYYWRNFLMHDIWRFMHLWFFSEISWGRANRNANPPGNLSSQQIVEHQVRELNNMFYIGWSWHIYRAKQEVILWNCEKSLVMLLMLSHGWHRTS